MSKIARINAAVSTAITCISLAAPAAHYLAAGPALSNSGHHSVVNMAIQAAPSSDPVPGGIGWD
jgi:hypothetical protein